MKSTTEKFAAPVLSSLTYKETVQLLRALNGGAAGFDYGRYKLAELRHIITTWQAQGAFSAELLTARIAEVIAARPARSVAPDNVAVPTFGATNVASVPPFNAPAPAAPVPPAVSVPVFGPMPAPIAAATPAEATPTPAPVAPAITIAEPTPAPHLTPAAPVNTGNGTPRRVLARELFADQPHVAAALSASLTVTVYDSPDAPPIDKDYIFSPGHVSALLSCIACAPTMRAWLVGPRGSGKTTCIAQIAARLGRPFFRVNFNRATESADVLGDIGLEHGATVFQKGPAALAINTPGAILLLDEISYAATGHTAALNPILEQRGPAVRLPRTGERISIAPDVFICAADNTSGHGDESGAGDYSGRGVMGEDTLDRFAAFLQFDYLPADDEAKVLRSMVKANCGVTLKADASKAIIRLCHVARQKADAGELSGAPSLRRAAAFATFVAMGMSPPVAWAQCVVNAAPQTSAEELRQIFAAHFPPDFSQTNFFNA